MMYWCILNLAVYYFRVFSALVYLAAVKEVVTSVLILNCNYVLSTQVLLHEFFIGIRPIRTLN